MRLIYGADIKIFLCKKQKSLDETEKSAATPFLIRRDTGNHSRSLHRA
jgi:hypothetical protein